MTVHEIERKTKGHWWDKDTMRFFGTRVHSAVYEGPGGTFFVTSEQPPHGPRLCSVREFIIEDDPSCTNPHHAKGSIETRGEFCAYRRYVAHRLARLAASGVARPFDYVAGEK